MLYGRYEHTIDAKNRVFIPAKFKDTLGTNFKITYNKMWNKCILIYSETEWENMLGKVKELSNYHNQFFKRDICSNTVDVQLDSQGRIVIPQYLKDKAGLSKTALILGIGEHAEIWAPEILEEQDALADLDGLKDQLKNITF